MRDAGITMSVLAYVKDSDVTDRVMNKTLMQHYANWVLKVQNQPTPNPGMDIRGEPKFYMSGAPYDKPWGRPQNDGPALRALVLTAYANQLVDEGRAADVLAGLYRVQVGQCCGIKFDLEYVAHNWQVDNFDVWEEVPGDHFFTKLIQRKALLQGAKLARRLNDGGAATFYEGVAQQLGDSLKGFWAPTLNSILVTRSRSGGFDKLNGYDSAVTLGVLYGDNGDGLFSATDDKVLATHANLFAFFADPAQSGFSINAQDSASGLAGTMFGRYPGDVYDGVGQSKGNPWILCTAGHADHAYRVATYLLTQASTVGRLTITPYAARFYGIAAALLPVQFASLQARVNDLAAKVAQAQQQQQDPGSLPSVVVSTGQEVMALASALVAYGDGNLQRLKLHSTADRGMPEQYNRIDGYQQGARDLTWSYGTIVSALSARAVASAAARAAARKL